MLTGVKTAEYIVNNIGSKEEIWNVNTDKKYHEKGE